MCFDFKSLENHLDKNKYQLKHLVTSEKNISFPITSYDKS